MDLRFPVPHHIVCGQFKLDAMFLMVKVNPSLLHNSDNGGQVFTDHVSLRFFMEHRTFLLYPACTISDEPGGTFLKCVAYEWYIEHRHIG